jgi:parallel beta-helix repeat protein
VVVSNAMFGTTYAVALANCGRDDATRCSVLRNVMRPKAVYPGTGVDLNRSHAALVSGNDIVGAGDMCSTSPDRCDCGRGITVDDTQRSTIVGNRVEGCSEEGILLANGAVAAHRPWLVSANTVINNTVRNNGFVGLAAYHDPRNPDDRNLGNVFSNNHVAGNGRGGCGSNAPDQTFVDNGPQPCVPGAGFTAGGRLPPAITSRSASGRSP